MRLMTEGMTNQQIAGRLCVTVHAVKFHLASIYRKLGVHNRTEAAVAFLEANGALKPRPYGDIVGCESPPLPPCPPALLVSSSPSGSSSQS